jgi:hypothetical protein
MKKSFMLLACAGALAVASCNRDNSADSGTAGTNTTDMSANESGSAAMGGYSETDYNRRADRIAADMATKMKLDEATRERVRTVYYNRSKRLGEVHSKYTQDTTGMAAAMREVYNEADTELKTVFTDPQQYSAYESSRPMYLEERYMSPDPNTTADGSTMAEQEDASMTSTDATMSNSEEQMNTSGSEGSMSSSGTASGSGSGATIGTMNASKVKAKAADGSKVKLKSDGDLKAKDAAGNKTKVAGDDGTYKEKSANGAKAVIK